MNLIEFKTFFCSNLANLYAKEECNQLFFLSIEHLLNLNLTDYLVNNTKEITPTQLEELKNILDRLGKEEPIQYIIGKTEFYDLEFIVNENTLIPRPETTDLVNWIITDTQNNNINILDIGTGSGCIAITLKKNIPNANVSAIDFSSKALEIAIQNATLNDVNIDFIEQDILKTDKLDKDYDIIVSNPPYVRNLEKSMMNNNVLNFEPHSALFVDDNTPLIFYDKIAYLAKNNLKKNGKLFFEINQYLSKEMELLLKEKGFKSIITKNDIFNKPRIIKATTT